MEDIHIPLNITNVPETRFSPLWNDKPKLGHWVGPTACRLNKIETEADMSIDSAPEEMVRRNLRPICVKFVGKGLTGPGLSHISPPPPESALRDHREEARLHGHGAGRRVRRIRRNPISAGWNASPPRGGAPAAEKARSAGGLAALTSERGRLRPFPCIFRATAVSPPDWTRRRQGRS